MKIICTKSEQERLLAVMTASSKCYSEVCPDEFEGDERCTLCTMQEIEWEIEHPVYNVAITGTFDISQDVEADTWEEAIKRLTDSLGEGFEIKTTHWRRV